MNDERHTNAERETGAGRAAGADPAADPRTGADRDHAKHLSVDQVGRESEQSFPASDAPSWSGSASSRGDESAPQGEQANWSVDREVSSPLSSHGVVDDDLRTALDDDHEPEADVPPPADDSLQA